MFKNNTFTIILLVCIVALLVGATYFFNKSPLLNFTIPGLKPIITIVPTNTPTATGGIQGAITIGPTKPICRLGESCTRPYATSILVKTQDGSSDVTSFTTNADGTFRVSLDPGMYILVQKQNGFFPRLTPVHVTVNANQFTRVDIMFDTGLR